MSLILIVSIMIRLLAMAWSLVLLRRVRDWRMGFLTMMLGLMALRQILTLLTQKESWAVLVTTGHLVTELPALLVGIMAFLAVFFLERIISERKRAEQMIREREQFFSGTLNDMLTLVAVLDPDGRVIFVNNTALDAGGITLDEIKGKMFDDAHWWQHSARARQQIREDIRVCTIGETLVHDIKFQDASGELVWIEYSMHPVYDESGKIKYLVPEGRDITGRKQADEHIRHLQRVLMAIRDVNQLIVHEKNRQKLLQGACDILNQTRDYKLVWIGLVRQDTMEVKPVAQAGFEHGYLKSIKITLDDSATGKGPTGTAIRTGKPAVILDIAGDSRYQPWQEEAVKRGYTSSAAIPLIHENKKYGALNVYAHLSDAFDEEELDLLVEVGQDIAFALHNIEVEQERKRAVDDLRKAHNELEEKVTARTRELAQANIQLKEMDRLKSEFIATMSHELRTPLNSIIGFVGIILKGIAGEINEEQKKQLSMVYSSARHLLSLINDILNLSRIESGKMEIFLTRFKLGEVVAEVAQILSPMISPKDLRLVTEITGDIPEITGDREKLFQILLNLTNNAVKFTSKGEIRIDCRMDNHNLMVTVSDTGIGIKRENMEYLFEAFRQVDGSAQRRYEGAGLGLHLCRKLVGLLGGTIWATSEYEKGSKFTFTLPIRFREGGQREKKDTVSRG